MGEDKKDGEGESLAKSVLGILGLSDVIVGGLFLYAAFHFERPTQTVFHTTGFTFVDVVLLACAAALIGKIILLFVAVLMGIARARHRKSRGADLRTALEEYAQTPGGKKRARETDPFEFASCVIALDNAGQATSIEKTRTMSIFAYASGLDTLLYTVRLWPQDIALGLWVGLVGLLLLLLGYLLQVDHTDSIINAFFALRERRSTSSADAPSGKVNNG
jgi:hypothetical protein